jgi:uncharacterized membrane protein YdjX (TVP38/TMEM64 family)
MRDRFEEPRQDWPLGRTRGSRPRFPVLLVVAGVSLASTMAGRALGLFDAVQGSIAETGFWAPVLYVALKAATSVIPFRVPGLSIAAGLLFGVGLGTLLTVAGETLGGSANFWIARGPGRSLVARIAGQPALDRVDGLSRRVGGWRGLLFARLVLPGYHLVSYAAGLSTLAFHKYLLVTLVAGAPLALIHVTIGATFGSDPLLYLFVSVGLASLYGVGFLALWLYRRKRRILRPIDGGAPAG